MTLVDALKASVASAKKATKAKIPYAGKEKNTGKSNRKGPRLPVPPTKLTDADIAASVVKDMGPAPKPLGKKLHAGKFHGEPVHGPTPADLGIAAVKADDAARAAAETLAHCDALLDVSGKQQAADPLELPASLDRTKGKTKEEIENMRKELNGKAEDAAKKILSPSEAKAAKAKATPAKPKGKTAGKAAKKGKGDGKPKGEIIANLLKRKNGATTADILEATGWKAVNVPRACKDAGLKCRKVKVGLVTRYYGS